jgi:hypothetical protein
MKPLLLCLALLPVLAAAAEPESFSASIQFEPKADAAALGLPLYPGATPRKDPGDSADGASFALWGGRFGIKLVAQKYAVDDHLECVASFYRDAMGRRSNLLDCSPPLPPPPAAKASGPKVLSCDDSNGEPGAKVYKAGTANHYRVVSLKQVGGAVHFELARVDIGE